MEIEVSEIMNNVENVCQQQKFKPSRHKKEVCVNQGYLWSIGPSSLGKDHSFQTSRKARQIDSPSTRHNISLPRHDTSKEEAEGRAVTGSIPLL